MYFEFQAPGTLSMFSSIKSGLEELEAGLLWGSHMCDKFLWITQSFLFSNKETDFQELKFQ